MSLISDVRDVRRLLKRLQSHVTDKLECRYQASYGHVDFVTAVNAKQVVYDPLYGLL